MARTYKQDYIDLLNSGIYVYMGERCPLCGEKIITPNYPEVNYNEHVCINSDCDYYYNDVISYKDLSC